MATRMLSCPLWAISGSPLAVSAAAHDSPNGCPISRLNVSGEANLFLCSTGSSSESPVGTTGEDKMTIGPKLKDRRHYSYDEGADEPPSLIDKVSTDIKRKIRSTIPIRWNKSKTKRATDI